MARIATVEKMVGLAIFLPSPAASFMTGVALLVDGGFERSRGPLAHRLGNRPQRRLGH